MLYFFISAYFGSFRFGPGLVRHRLELGAVEHFAGQPVALGIGPKQPYPGVRIRVKDAYCN